MCTVTIVPRADGFRLVCNRDESRSRPTALPPVRRVADGVPVWYPRDPQGGGTWVAANGHHLTVALLNRQQLPTLPVDAGEIAERRTRGQIVVALAQASTVSAVRARLSEVNPGDHAPFRLIAVQNRDVLIATSDGRQLEIADTLLTTPLLFTSSSLSDDEAERRRRPLFDEIVLRGNDPFAGQKSFHDHRWPDCPEFSVRMERADARTVSRTVVDVTGRRVSLTYEPLPLEG